MTTLEAPEISGTAPEATDEPPRSQRMLDVHDWLALGAVVLLCSGFFTLSLVPGWSPRFAVLLAVLPPGAVFLTRLARERDPAALALIAALAWTAVVIPFQPSPWIRVFGVVGLETSLLIWVCVAACWALGRQLGESAKRLLPWVMIAALVVCGAIGILQVAAQTETGSMVLERGRAHGLATYSIYYGSLLSAAAVLLAALDVSRRWRLAQIAGIGGFALCSGLSGSRAALLALVVGLVYLVAKRRDALRVFALLAMVFGVVASTWLSDFFAERAAESNAATVAVVDADTGAPAADTAATDDATADEDPAPAATSSSPDSGSTVGRLTSSDGFAGGGISWRIDAWEAGAEAWIERPITGWGVGNFRQAVQGSVGAGFEQEAPRFDAHNLFVELLATIGLPGLLLFTAFGVFVARSARGPLAIAAVTLAWSWLLQPAGVSTLPLAMLLLGSAHLASASPPAIDIADSGEAPSVESADQPVDDPAGETEDVPPAERTVRAATLAGLALGVGFFVADLRLASAVDDIDPVAIESAATFFPTDPTVADLVAQGWTYRAIDTPVGQREAAVESALDWSQRAVSRQPDSPRWLDHLAFRQARFGDYEAAVRTLGEALELQPRRSESRDLLVRISDVADDDEIDELIDEVRCAARGARCDQTGG